jgi:hypothetical protein
MFPVASGIVGLLVSRPLLAPPSSLPASDGVAGAGWQSTR